MSKNLKWLWRGVIVTPFFIFLSVIFGAGGHGTAFVAILLYPGIFIINSDDELHVVLLMVLQYPLYGFVMDIARKHEDANGQIYLLFLIAIHTGCMIFATIRVITILS